MSRSTQYRRQPVQVPTSAGRRVAVAALALLAAALGGAAAGRAAPAAVVPCTSIAFAGVSVTAQAPVAIVYRVDVNTRAAACGAARSVLRAAVYRPATFISGPSAVVAGWHCRRWQNAEPWTVSCAHGDVVARAYGPATDTDPWLLAAVGGTMPVLQPTAAGSLGFQLQSVTRNPACKNTVPQQQVTARYARADGATLEIIEDDPQCGNLGLAPLLGRWRIHDRPAELLEWCGWLGCSRTSGEYALHWQERGDDIVVFTHALRQTELLALARSMSLVRR
jgi:hypothetical protein